MGDGIVKVCPCCGEQFRLQDIVYRRDIEPIGMLIDDPDMAHNFYFFNHLAPFCGTTFTIQVEQLRSLVCEQMPLARLAGTAECGEHCFDLVDVDPCDRECYYAPYRRLLQCLKDLRREQ